MEKINFISIFSSIEDPRIERTKKHLLVEILFLVVCGVISGANYISHIEIFGNTHIQWLRQYFLFKNGIPSNHTIGRVLSLINFEVFQESFCAWMQSIQQLTNEIVAIDGKTVRRSYDKKSNKKAIHMVSAWATHANVCLGQMKVDEKSNEITAIPELLKLLEIKGCIITIDAMGCQKKIAKQIIKKKADYVLALKGNQGDLYTNVKDFFEDAIENNFHDISYDYHKTKNVDHGRIETREYYCTDVIYWIEEKKEWEKLNAIGMAKTTTIINDTNSCETRYFILSSEANAEKFGMAVRKHWGIENSLHWCLDVGFREDESRIRKDDAPINTAIIRHICMNLLKNDKSVKGGIEAKRLRAAWDNSYRKKIISQKI